MIFHIRQSVEKRQKRIGPAVSSFIGISTSIVIQQQSKGVCLGKSVSKKWKGLNEITVINDEMLQSMVNDG